MFYDSSAGSFTREDHVSFIRLLSACERNLAEGNELLDQIRLEQFLKHLQSQLAKLEVSCAAHNISSTNMDGSKELIFHTSVEDLASYRARFDAVKSRAAEKWAEEERQETEVAMKALAAEEAPPPHNGGGPSAAQSSGSHGTTLRQPPPDQRTRGAGSGCGGGTRAFQFRRREEGERGGGGARRATRADREAVDRERAVQSYLTEELAEMAGRLKDGSLAIHQSLRGQNQLLEEMGRAAEENAEKVAAEGSRLQKYLRSQGLGVCEAVFLALVVVLGFVATYMFIKVFPKRPSRPPPRQPAAPAAAAPPASLGAPTEAAAGSAPAAPLLSGDERPPPGHQQCGWPAEAAEGGGSAAAAAPACGAPALGEEGRRLLREFEAAAGSFVGDGQGGDGLEMAARLEGGLASFSVEENEMASQEQLGQEEIDEQLGQSSKVPKEDPSHFQHPREEL